MKRSKKPLTFTAIAASIGALSMAVEGCVYGPPPETNVYGPPPDPTASEQTLESNDIDKPISKPEATDEVYVYGPAPDVVDGPEEDVYGPPVDDEIEEDHEQLVYGPPADFGD